MSRFAVFATLILSFHLALASSAPLSAKDLVLKAFAARQTETLTKQSQVAVQGQFNDLTARSNPEVQIGFGSIDNTIARGAGYREWGVSQRLSISGAKDRLMEQKELAVSQSSLESDQYKLQVAKQALLLGYTLLAEQEKQQHAQERLSRLMKLRRYMTSRQFPAPQQQVELEFLKNKINEVALEVEFVEKTVVMAQNQLQSFLGIDHAPALAMAWLPKENLKKIEQSFIKKDSFEEKKLESQIAQLDKAYRSKAVQWVPDLNLYYQESEEQFFGGNHNRTLGIGIEVPLFNAGISAKQKVLAEKNLKQLKLENTKVDEALQKQEIMTRIEKSLLVIDQYSPRHLERLETALQKATTNFDRGLISANQFVDLEDQVHNVHYARLNHLLESHALSLSLIQMWGSVDDLREFYQ